jgi:hypothetical protein
MTTPSEHEHGGERRLHPEVLLARHRARLEQLLQHPLVPPRPSGIAEEKRRYLLEEAEDLYWNELEWERLTSEEMRTGGSELVELAFPGFLAFVDGLLLKKVADDSLAPASPRPEVVQDILVFLARRHLELLPETDPALRLERDMTQRLIDLVLYRLHGLQVDGFDPFANRGMDDD